MWHPASTPRVNSRYCILETSYPHTKRETMAVSDHGMRAGKHYVTFNMANDFQAARIGIGHDIFYIMLSVGRWCCWPIKNQEEKGIRGLEVYYGDGDQSGKQ